MTLVRFTAPTSVQCTANLDDRGTLRELGLTELGTDKRGRLRLEAPDLRGFLNVIDTCINMGRDHGDEDPYARNALKWADREAAKLLAAGLAVRDGYGLLRVAQ